jgi:hypothetical protein
MLYHGFVMGQILLWGIHLRELDLQKPDEKPDLLESNKMEKI